MHLGGRNSARPDRCQPSPQPPTPEQTTDRRATPPSQQQLATYTNALRGRDLDQSDFAAADTRVAFLDEEDSTRTTSTSGGVGTRIGDELPLLYDPEAIAAFWRRRPVSVVRRMLQLATVGGGFVAGLTSDALTGRLKDPACQANAAVELRGVLTSLGPAYIKIGQALAIRPDLLSPIAMVELQRLCDKVPSFPTRDAMAILERELGVSAESIFEDMTPEPVAAASLGQVYKARLRSTGEPVAVKVQRPAVLETVTVDLFLIRALGGFLATLPPKFRPKTDVVGLLDEWAKSFFGELDYEQEARYALRFADDMAADLPQIVVPRPVLSATSRRVLTAQWLEGEKLAQSSASDVSDLVNLGVICYLKQLLGTGFFHADPHPGNLIRTPDGRLAVLDFGLMTEVDDDVKQGMVDAIAHLYHRDYDAILDDFITLQFIPPGTDLKPIQPVLAKVFDQALQGGGAKSLNFNDLAADLAQVTFDYPFQIPPYFAVIIRAVGVLEGIALSSRPDFALIDEAFPYLARMLLSAGEDQPRLRASLRYMVYGKEGVFDVARLIELLGAFETWAANSKTALGDGRAIDGSDRETDEPPLLLSAAGNVAPAVPSEVPAANVIVASVLGSSDGDLGSALPGVPAPTPAAAQPAAVIAAETPPPVREPRRPASPLGAAASVLGSLDESLDSLKAVVDPDNRLPPRLPLLSLAARSLDEADRAIGGVGRGSSAAALPLPGGSEPTAALATTAAGSAFGGSSSGGQGVGGPQAREALRFVLGPDGAFFRSFLLDEAVATADALGREGALAALERIGAGGLVLPSPLAALAGRPLTRVAPTVTEDDRRRVENLGLIVDFLLGGRGAGGGQKEGGGWASETNQKGSGASTSTSLAARVPGPGSTVDPALVADLAPLLPGLASEVLPELQSRLVSRLAARALRETFGAV